MHAFTSPETHLGAHAARAAELAAEATAWHLAREARGGAPGPSAGLRNRLGEALVGAGIRLMEPAHLQTRIARAPHAAA